MTTETKPRKTPPTWDKKEKDAISDYGCELLLENAGQEELKKTNYPSDAMIVTYKLKDKVCLLYTSPSPRDGLLSRMPSSA